MQMKCTTDGYIRGWVYNQCMDCVCKHCEKPMTHNGTRMTRDGKTYRFFCPICARHKTMKEVSK